MKGAALALLLLAGCAAGPEIRSGIESERLCAPPEAGLGHALPPLAPLAVVEATAARHGKPVLAVLMADTLGLLPELEAIARPRPGLAGEVAKLRRRQLVQERLMLAMLEAAGTMAAIDCEGERGDQLRGLLQAREDRRNRRLSIASIALGRPTRTSGMPKRARSLARRRSQAAAISSPAPRHQPWMRAITGTGQARMAALTALMRRMKARAASGVAMAPISRMSAPPMKARSPSPASTTARVAASTAKALASASRIGVFTVFSLASLRSVTRRMSPCCVTSTLIGGHPSSARSPC